MDGKAVLRREGSLGLATANNPSACGDSIFLRCCRRLSEHALRAPVVCPLCGQRYAKHRPERRYATVYQSWLKQQIVDERLRLRTGKSKRQATVAFYVTSSSLTLMARAFHARITYNA